MYYEENKTYKDIHNLYENISYKYITQLINGYRRKKLLENYKKEK